MKNYLIQDKNLCLINNHVINIRQYSLTFINGIYRKEIEYNEYGRKILEENSFNNLLHGKQLNYKKFINTQFETNYQYGKKHCISKIIIYRENDDIKTEIEYQINDPRYGKEIEYFDNGNIKSETYFYNNLFHGPQTKYYKNGKKECITYYENGIIKKYKY